MTNEFESAIILPLSKATRESGGTGRRARLRGVWITPYGFKSRFSHQVKQPYGCFAYIIRNLYADVAELADALDSGSSESNFMWVQLPSSAPCENTLDFRGCFCVVWVTGVEGETAQSGLPVDVRDRGRPSAQFARESTPVIRTK